MSLYGNVVSIKIDLENKAEINKSVFVEFKDVHQS